MYVGALHVAPQLVDSLKPIWLHEVPSFDTSCHTATRWLSPALATHWRSCTTTPSTGFAVHVVAPSVLADTVALPSHRSVMYKVLGLAGSGATLESPLPGRLARSEAGVSTQLAPALVDLNTL